MRILPYELRKVLCYPLIWGIIAVFVGFNVFFVYSNVGYTDFQREIREMHEVVLGNIQEGELYDLYTQYKALYSGSYNDLDMQSIKRMKEKMLKFEPDGSYAEFINSNYDKLQKRVKQIEADGDTDRGFYPGDIFGIHGKLSSLLRLCIIEALIIMCLSVLYLMDFERINHTEDLVFPSWIGRSAMRIKLRAGIIGGMLFAALVLVVSVGAFFLFVPMSGLWRTSVSSYLVMESNGLWEYPFITFVRLNIWQELVLELVVALLTVLLIGLIAGTVQLFVNNSYFTIICIASVFVGFLALPVTIRNASWIKTAVSLTPSTMWRYCGRWFIENDMPVSFAWSEFFTLGIWFMLTIIFLLCGIRFMQTKDI